MTSQGADRAPDPSAKRGGGKRSVDMRAVVNGLMYVLSTGCQWRAIPKDLAARSTVHDYFDLWDYDGTLEHDPSHAATSPRPGACGSGGQPDGSHHR